MSVSSLRASAHWIAAAIVLAAGLAVTWGLVRQQSAALGRVEQARLNDAADAATAALARRMDAHAGVVAGLRDLFRVDPGLDCRRFERMAAERGVRRRHPEIRDLGFTRRVPAERRAAEGAAAHPGAERYVVECLWSRDGGDEGLRGLDEGARPDRLAALLAARASGRPVASAPIDAARASGGGGTFTLHYPVFVDEPAAGAGAPRFVGTVAATVQLDEMLDALRGAGFLRGVALRLRDVQAAPAEPPPGAAPGSVARELEMHGRQWRLDYAPAQSLLSRTERLLPRWIGETGLALSLLLALAAGLLVRQRALGPEWGEALRGSEQRLRAMFDQTAVGVALIDMDTERFERVNGKLCELLGYTREEMLQRDVRAISHPDDYPPNRALREQLRRGVVSAFHMEKRLLRKDGTVVWIDLTVAPVMRQGQAPSHNVGVIQDITERRRMRDELQASEQRLRSILDHLPVGVIVWQNGMNVVFRNRRFVEITGYDADTLAEGAEWWVQAHPDPVARERARVLWRERCWHARAHGGTIGRDEYEIHCADGVARPFAISGVLFADTELFIFEDLSRHRAAEDEINYLASYDPLTGLANRRLLVQRLGDALAASARDAQCGALLMLDLDHFKTLNETRGHEHGDALLRQVAQRLRDCTQAQDTLARHGDDEFVLVLGDLSANLDDATTHARKVGERILSALRAPFMLAGEHCHTTASVGAAVFRGEELNVDTLLQQVDMAMYQAKAAGRDTLRFYDPRIQARVRMRAQLERDLRDALEQKQFELFYQAQLHEDRIIGAEALVRWRHPRDGFVSPAQFIALAEETGLILPLGHWVLETACRQLAAWAADPQLARLSLAVNISPRQFYQADFVAQVLAALARSGADARRLELELTEGLLLQDVEDTVAKMTQLKAYGVDFALDDFGTGYSSLSYLKRLPLDQLKIDQSFVRDVLIDPNDAAIARTIVALGTNLGLRVIAEGVETEEQRAFLQRHGCVVWQGYLFGKPVPVAQFEALVRGTPVLA